VRTADIRLENLPDGPQTIEVLGQDFAGEWQVEPTVVNWTVQPHAQIVISEILASNTGAVQNGETTPDYIELQNVGGAEINLRGFSLSDDGGELRKFTFATDMIVQPGGYLIVYADSQSGAPGIHLGFGLRKDGEGVYLSAPETSGGELLDSVTFGPQIDNLAISRVGADQHWELSISTPGAENSWQPTGDRALLSINEWLANDDTMADFIELYNADTLPVPLAGLYLTDELGTAPTLHQIQPLSFVAGRGFVAMSADGPDSLSFKLSSDQEVLALLDQQQNLVDVVVYYPQTTNFSQGRFPAGGNEYRFFESPTPGRANGPRAVGDFNADESYTTADLDLLYAAIGNEKLVPEEIAEFDLTDDQQVNDQDVTRWVTEFAGTVLGDVNLDGSLGFSDFLVLSANFGRENAGWGLGDFNGDKKVDFDDFLALSANFGFEKGR
jgi:hypothetical protein